MSDVKSGGFCRIVSLRALIQGPWIQGFLIRPTNNHSFVVFFLEGGGGNSDSFNCCKFCFFKKKNSLKHRCWTLLLWSFPFGKAYVFSGAMVVLEGGSRSLLLLRCFLGTKSSASWVEKAQVNGIKRCKYLGGWVKLKIYTKCRSRLK